MSAGSITGPMVRLGDEHTREDAARVLWDRFIGDMTRYARRRLRAMRTGGGVADEDDVAARAIERVFRAIALGKLRDRIAGREDLKRLLHWATRLEAINQAGRDHRAAAVRPIEDADALADTAHGPDWSLEAVEECERLIEALGREDLRLIVLCKVLGHTNREIADALDVESETVERKLGIIRAKWSKLRPVQPPRPGPRGGIGASVAVSELPPVAILLREIMPH